MIRAFLFTYFLLQNVASSFDCSELDLSLSYISRSPYSLQDRKNAFEREQSGDRKQGGVVAGGLASADRHSAQGH